MHFSEYIKNVFFNHKLDSQVFNEMIMKRTIKKTLFSQIKLYFHISCYIKRAVILVAKILKC